MLLCLTPSCITNFPKCIVCLGDSLTACEGAGGRYSDWLQLDLSYYEVINSGIGGCETGKGTVSSSPGGYLLHAQLFFPAGKPKEPGRRAGKRHGNMKNIL